MSDAIPVLIIDDDARYCRLVRDYLEPVGFAVDMAHDGPSGIEKAAAMAYHALLLDLMLPGMDGYEVLRRLREEPATARLPVLMLTARGDETDRIVGLEMGADDYVPKTFSHRELLARLRAVVRRGRIEAAASSHDQETLSVGALRIDLGACAVSVRDEPVELTPIEFRMLVALARSRGRVLSRDQLLDAAAVGRSHESFDRSVDMHISSLRRKLGDDPHKPAYIKTVRAMGYMLLAGESW
jgi:two-component system response regulator CpxR